MLISESVNGARSFRPSRLLVGYGQLVFLNALTNVAFLLKEVALAGAYGIAGGLDTFVLATGFILIPTQCLFGILQTLVVPRVLAVNQRADEHHFLRGVLLLVSVLWIITWLILLFAVDQAIGVWFSNLADERRQIFRSEILWLSPVFLLSGASLLVQGYLLSQRAFLAAFIPSAVQPVVVALYVVLLRSGTSTVNLAAVTSFGAALELLLVLYFAQARGLRLLSKSFDWSGVRSLIRDTAIMLLGVMPVSLLPSIDQMMVLNRAPGVVSALNFANKVPAAIAALCGLTVATVCYPYFAKDVVTGDSRSALALLRSVTQVLVPSMILLVLLLNLYSVEIIAILYGRGRFDSESVVLVAKLQEWYMWTLPPFAAGALFARFLTAAGWLSAIAFIGLTSVLLKIILNLVLVRSLGLRGIPIGYIVVYCFSLLAMYMCVRQRIVKERT